MLFNFQLQGSFLFLFFPVFLLNWTGELGCLVCGQNLRRKENVKTHMRTIQEEKVWRRSPAPPAPSSVRALPRSRPPKIRSLAGPGVEAGGVPCPAPGLSGCPSSPDLACWSGGGEREWSQDFPHRAPSCSCPAPRRTFLGDPGHLPGPGVVGGEPRPCPRPAAGPEDVGGESGQLEMDVGPQEG